MAHKSSSFFEVILKCLKVCYSSAHTIICKHKRNSIIRPSGKSGRRHNLSPTDESKFQNHTKETHEDVGRNGHQKKKSVFTVKYRLLSKDEATYVLT